MRKTLCLMFLACLMCLPASLQADNAFMLFSLEEAKELRLDDAEWEKGGQPKGIGFGVGPKIIFESPVVKETDKGLLIDAPSRMDLLVLFKDGVSPVVMESLEIRARKGWFSKDLTERLQPYLQGKAIKAENVTIPSGRFKLEIKVADTAGNESLQEYLCEIRD